MFVQLIENAAKVLVYGPIRDESLGDLWELDYQLKLRQTPKLVRLVKALWNFLQIIQASLVLWLEEQAMPLIQGRQLGTQATSDSVQGCELTPEAIAEVRRYCNIRRFYNSTLSRKLLHYPPSAQGYWLKQCDRILDQGQARGHRILNTETLVNSFILSHFVRKLETVHPDQVNIHTFEHLVKDIALTEAFLDRYIAFDRQSYGRQLIFRTWSLAVYVISWMPGQESWLHHHGHALDAIKVIQGEMTHWLVAPGDREGDVPFEGFSRPKRYDGPSQVFSAGDLVLIDRGYGHQISNCSGQNLVTLHVRFGHPPEDDHWRTTSDTEMLVWKQAEGYFDLMPRDRGCVFPRA
jgi:mannose-6-phosphate isomerase-like protein (cupin superfamily)